MLLYADGPALERFTDSAPPANAKALLRHASTLVRNATRAALYETLPSGLPVDDDLREALADATCAQAGMWAAAGIDPTAAGVGQSTPTVVSESKSINGASVSKSFADLSTSVTVATARAQAATQLCPEAVAILENAGLTNGQPRYL